MDDDDHTERGCILDDDPLNSAAFYAILGFSTNRERALINLLRSDRPIDPLVREALASALEGDAPYGSVLRFSGAEDLRTKAGSIQARREWMKIGDWISGERENGRKYDNAVVMAAGKFSCSQKKCERALGPDQREEAGMNLNEAIAGTRRRIEALDLSAENARLAEIAEQLAQIDRALSAANARREEVLILLRPYRSNSGSIPLPDGTGGSVANALLAGVSASEAAGVAVDEAQLERELDALKAGMAELQQRQSNLTTERLSLPSAVGRRIMAEIKPLCDAIESEARDAASIIEEAFAALSAITKATRTHSVALEATAAAIAGMRGGRGLLVASDTVSVPAGITEVLALLAEKGPAYTGGKPTSVRVAENEGRDTAKAMAQAVADYDGPETPEMATAKVVQKKWWGRN